MLLQIAPFLLAATGLQLDHKPVDCMVKDKFLLIDASIVPAEEVTKARVYFRSAQQDEFYVVDMALRRGLFVAKLPRPQEKEGPIIYYIEARADGGSRRTPEMSAEVVKDARSCKDGRLAQVASEGDVRVYSTTSSTSKPKGFDGVSGVGKAPAGVGRAVVPEERRAEQGPRQQERDRGRKEEELPASKAPKPAPTPKPALPPVEVAAATPDEGLEALAVVGDQDYPIGPDDVLKVTVYGSDELKDQMFVVQADGTFTFPMIGRVKAEDLTPKELEGKIATLLAAGFVRDPQVSVVIHEYRSHVVYVAGEVTKPGVYPLMGSRSLMEVLSRAGPMTLSAAAEALVVRPREADQGPVVPQPGASDTEVVIPKEKADVVRINILDIQSGKLEKNILLKPNDTVFVPKASRVYVSGEVRNPGAYAIVSKMSVRQAISIAGGFTDRAAEGRIRIVRMVAGKAKELKVKLDDPVEPDDNLIVKEKMF